MLYGLIYKINKHNYSYYIRTICWLLITFSIIDISFVFNIRILTLGNKNLKYTLKPYYIVQVHIAKC